MTPTTKDPRMPDPITLQRQLLAATERATDLEAQVDRLAEKVATLSVRDEAHTYLRLGRLEAAVCSLGVDLPAMGPVDAAVRSVAAGRLSATGDEQ